MPEPVVQLVVENPSDILSYLPQYAALITASVAILLFFIKEILELRRKAKERKVNKKAIERVASIQGVKIIEQILFIVKLSNAVKSPNDILDIHIKTDHLSNARRIIIDERVDLYIPPPIEKFSYEVLLLAAKSGDEQFSLFANMNDINSYFSYNINLFVKKITNKEIKRVSNELKDKDRTRDMVAEFLKILSPIAPAMSKNKGYKDIMDILDDELKKL